MRVADFLNALTDEARKAKPGTRTLRDGWLLTKDIVPLLGVSTMSGARLPLERMIKAGYVERIEITPVRFAFRLSPRFKSWAEASRKAADLFKTFVPVGWVSLSNYARKKRRTVRGIQYRLDDAKLPSKVFRVPRPVKHYRVADLDRLLRKAS